MITHNGTYLLHATHHGMQIQAATMGGKIVFGSKRLLPATQLAIVAAFGAEGTEVIRKTNDYLNRIATTDPQRARLLAGFINEDPLLVCSLVETSKTRWLVGDGKAWIESGVTPNNTSSIDITFRRTEASQTSRYGLGAPFGIRNPNALGFTVVTDPVAYYAKFGGTQVTNIGDPRNTDIHNVKMSAAGTFYDGEQKMSAVSQTFTITGTYILFGWVDATTKKFAVPYAIEQAHYKDSSIEQDFVPFLRNGSSGMLDIISGTFHPNANTEGTFTIQITDKA